MSKERTRKYSLIEKILFPKVSLSEKKLKEKVSGKTILITGASYGIGEEVSKLLANTSAHLILVGRTKDKLNLVKEEVERGGATAEVYAVDLRVEEEIQALISSIKGKSQLDVIISNAGKSIRRPLTESLDRYHDFSRTMAINYEAPVKILLALLPILESSKGHVINVSAMNVLMAPAPYWAAYQASKTAFDQWFRCAIPEIENLNISTTSIYLPLVRTRMVEPTKAYKNMPAMSADHVAKIIGNRIVNRKRVYKPWWSLPGELGSVIFRKTWARMSRNQIKKSRN